MAEVLDQEAIMDRLTEYEGWEQQGQRLMKRFTFEDFAAAIDFVDAVAAIAEDLEHHPDIAVQHYDEVLLSITSHEQNALTAQDFAFVDRVEDLEAVDR